MNAQFDDFQIVGEIGSGGMGIVYRAHQQSLPRDVALKVLPETLVREPAIRERFKAEARRMAQLTHPNIAQIYVVGDRDGVPYFAMQYLPGGTLEDRLRLGPLPVAEAVAIAIEIANALDYAHSQGIVHRDVKPANIMFDAHGRPIITDFGIAKAADDYQLTSTGMLMGTPDYMSPEQARGNPVDGRTDIYALGVVLYEMVCGRPPFTGDTPLSVAMKHVNDTPPPPSAMCPDVPPWLESIIFRALAKQPANRFLTAREMGAALQAGPAADVGPRQTQLYREATAPGTAATHAVSMVAARPPTPSYIPALIALCVVCLMVGIGSIALVFSERHRERRPEPTMPPPPVGGGSAGGGAGGSARADDWQPQSIVLGHSRNGLPIAGKILGNGRNVTAVFGALHGDEPVSHGIVLRLVEHIRENPGEIRGCTVIAVPAVNPDGLNRHTRTNARGVDLNRNFDAGNWQPGEPGRYYPGPAPFSEPESRAIRGCLDRYMPHKIIATHQPMAMLNPTGLGVHLAREMSKHNGYRVDEDVGYRTPGDFGTYCGMKLGLQMVTLELSADEVEASWETHREALLSAVRYAEHLPNVRGDRGIPIALDTTSPSEPLPDA